MKNGDPLLTTALSTGQGIAPTLPQQAIGIPSLLRVGKPRTPESSSEILLMLARNAERSAATDAIRLLRLNLPLPDEPALLSNLLCQRFLTACGLQVTTLWLEWQEKRAARRCLQVFSVDR